MPAAASPPAAGATLAARLGTTAAGAAQALPAEVGTGYLRTLSLGPLLQLTTYHVTLHRELDWQRPATASASPTVLFSFRYLPPPPGLESPLPVALGPSRLPAVQVATAGQDFAVRLPAGVPLTGLLLTTNAALFADLLDEVPSGSVLAAVVAGQHQALYEEVVTPAMLAVAAELLAPALAGPLRRYFLKTRAEALIYLLLDALRQRGPTLARPLSAAQARRLYVVRDHLLADLSEPPSLPALARLGGLSETQLKRLFKQVFGDTVYGYFQTVRLGEAARLLRDEQHSVTEVAYQLGFRNLSHFGRLFRRHFGQKPKHYSQKH